MRCQIRCKNHSTLINTTDTDSWIANNSDSNDLEEKSKTCGGICCVLRIIQIGFFLVLIYVFSFLVKGLLFVPTIRENSSLSPIEEAAFDLPEISILDRSGLSEPSSSTLLDIKDFRLLIEPTKSFCRVDDLLFLLVVHSKPDHFRQRQAIRATWASVKKFTGADGDAWSARAVFILGQPVYPFQSQGLGLDVDELLGKEAEHFQDIVIGSFEDRYHNLRYKNILGLRWAVSQCPHTAYILKADDDAFVDLLSLYQYLKRTFNPLYQKNVLAGNVFPDGALAQRMGKWAVSVLEYPWKKYPSYLGGLAYLMSPDVARDLYMTAHTNKVPQVWVDDVWVTGLLARSLDLHPLYLNPRYSYDHQEMVQWLRNVSLRPDQPHKPPFTFAHLDPTINDWKDTLEQLWNHVLKFYGVTSDVKEHSFKTNISLFKNGR